MKNQLPLQPFTTAILTCSGLDGAKPFETAVMRVPGGVIYYGNDDFGSDTFVPMSAEAIIEYNESVK